MRRIDKVLNMPKEKLEKFIIDIVCANEVDVNTECKGNCDECWKKEQEE